MGIQFSVDEIADYVTAGIQVQALANQTARISGRFTGASVKAILDGSCRSVGGGREFRSTSRNGASTSRPVQRRSLTESRLRPSGPSILPTRPTRF